MRYATVRVSHQSGPLPEGSQRVDADAALPADPPDIPLTVAGDGIAKSQHRTKNESMSEKIDFWSNLLLCPNMSTSDSSGTPDSAPRVDKPFRLYTAASVGPAIRHYREEAGLTQEELAAMAGLNRSYLSELEQGRETEQMRRILRLLKLLGVRATLQKADW